MLPPFVPPSARVPTQILPLITDFVVDREERIGNSSVATPPWESQTRAHAQETASETASAAAPEREPAHGAPHQPERELTLPSIDEFLLRLPVGAQPESGRSEAPIDEASERPSAAVAVESGVGSADISAEMTPLTATHPEESPVREAVALVQDFTEETPRREPEQQSASMEQQSEQPRFEPVPASASVAQEGERAAVEKPEAEAEEQPAAAETVPEEAPTDVSGPEEPPSAPTPEAWVSEERDSFNWQSAANLAAGPDEEKRASEEWSSTDWEPRAGGSQDHIVALLAQVARRVRSGELQIHGSRKMSAEAALAAVLAAMLTEPD